MAQTRTKKKESHENVEEGGSSSHVRDRKGKAIARDDPDEEEVSQDSESENDPAPKQKRARTPREPKKKKGKAPEKPKKKKKPSPSEIVTRLEAMTFKPTVYPDAFVLQQLGLYEDVRFLLEKMGIASLLTLQRPGYEEATHLFLSTLEAKFFWEEDAEDGFGFIRFKIGKRPYRMSFKRISEVMGFPDGRDSHMGGGKDDRIDIWSMIGVGDYDSKLVKGADIRNPSLRYVQRILANTLYGRKDVGRVLEEELRYLIWGLKDVIGEKFDSGNWVYDGDQIKPGITAIFVSRLLSYQEWAWTNKAKEPELRIGGLITPLLEAMEVPLPDHDVGYGVMDEGYLTHMGFLDGRVGDRWVYRFKEVKEEDNFVRTFLPNQAITSLAVRDNLLFKLPQELFYNADIHEIPKKISRSKKKRAAIASEQDEEDEEEPSGTVYGSSRYYFQPYSGALPDGPLRDAHVQIRTLQRGQKFQDRTIAKLVKSVNYLAKKLKNLTFRPRRSRASTPVTTDDPMEDDGTAVEEEPVHAHRHSYHGDASATETYYEEPRTSLREPRQRRPRKPRHPVPPLPTNESGNETPYVPTSGTDDTLGYTEP